ncbi:hypothetical protein IKQ74_02060 [Candidatus Saccharibacteria bacterium]|nr:hypothetical protein [Candidatus Saccharibacteria bacterium]
MSIANATFRAVRIKDLEGYDPDEFCISPSSWGYRDVEEYPSETLLLMAQEKAATVDDICIVVVNDELGEYVIGCGGHLKLFNAAPVYTNTGIRAITYNTGRGALTRYWYDQRVEYRPRSTV